MPLPRPETVSYTHLDVYKRQFLNRALESYAVGSVFKPVLAAAALEQGILPEYECTGAVVRCV